jgi:putative hydrolase of the HAD superfamily
VVELVCFDWGGVLLRICRTWEDAIRRAGLPLRPPAADPVLAERRSRIALLFQTGRIGPQEFFEGVAAHTAGCYTAEEVARVHDAWLCEEYPGVADLIDRLGGRVRTALLSNTNPIHYARGTGVNGSAPEFPTVSRLHARYASHLLGLAKPDEAIYHRVAELERIEPSRILFFDDTPDNVAAARRCGWRAEQVDHAGDTAEQMARFLRAHGVEC